jgi:hypothetical protein
MFATVGVDAVACTCDGRLTHRDSELQQFPVNPGAPHRGFAADMSRISARTLCGTPGRPVRCRLIQLQNERKRRRCHATTVSGLMIYTAERQPHHACASHAHSMRATDVKRRRGRQAEQRDDDGRHECGLSQNARNLSRSNAYRVSGRHSHVSHANT